MIENLFHHPAMAISQPDLDFDFTSASLDSRVSFVRTTNATNPATYVASNGYIVLSNDNEPRFDYDPANLFCRGLLIEEARTNLLKYSSVFDNAAWNTLPPLTGASWLPNASTSPDGSNNSYKLVEDTSTGLHQFRPYIAGVASANRVLSFYVKDAGRANVRFGFGNSDPADFVVFNMNTGFFSGKGAGITNATATNAGNGFWRVSLYRSAASASSNYIFVQLLDDLLNTSYSGDGTSGVFIWGAQLEIGASTTSYIPTSATSLTRNADIATITGANFSNWWQAGRGSALVRARPGTVSGVRPWVQFDDATADNIIALRGNTTNPELYIRSGGSDQVQIDAGTIAVNTNYRLASAWATNDCAASINSGAAVRDGVATIPVVTQARIGSDGTNYLNGHIQAIEYYNERVLNASLQVLSSQAGRNSIIGPVFRDGIIA